eukprot:10749787-Alexandrium_andersonii.AAC.1
MSENLHAGTLAVNQTAWPAHKYRRVITQWDNHMRSWHSDIQIAKCHRLWCEYTQRNTNHKRPGNKPEAQSQQHPCNVQPNHPQLRGAEPDAAP